MAPMNTALVTGANKGIGLAIVRNIALRYPSSALSSNGTVPLLIYLTARDVGRGEAAVKELDSDQQLKKAKALQADGGLSQIRFRQLDISKEASIRDTGAWLKEQHPEGIDVVVNNAGIAMQGFDLDVVKETLASNYFGTLLATETFLPHIRPGGRLVNVSSMAGHLGSSYSTETASAFRNAKTVDEVTALMEKFTDGVKNGTHQQDGFPSAAYAVSKAGVIGMTRAIAHRQQANASATPSVLINSCCPGFVDTSMTSKMKSSNKLTADEGASVPVQLALDDLNGTTGEFWREGQVVKW